MKSLFTKVLAALALSLILGAWARPSAFAYTSTDAPDGDLSVTLTTITSPSAEGDTYQVKAVVKNEGTTDIAAASGAQIRLVFSSSQLDGINLVGSAPNGWTCTPSYNADYKSSMLECAYSGSVAAGEQIEFMVTGKVQDCGYVTGGLGTVGSIDSFNFIRGYVSGSVGSTNYVYNDTNTGNDNSDIVSNQSEWCNATNEKITSVDDVNKKINGDTSATASTTSTVTKVPKTGSSSQLASLMVVLSGLSLAMVSIPIIRRIRG